MPARSKAVKKSGQRDANQASLLSFFVKKTTSHENKPKQRKDDASPFQMLPVDAKEKESIHLPMIGSPQPASASNPQSTVTPESPPHSIYNKELKESHMSTPKEQLPLVTTADGPVIESSKENEEDSEEDYDEAEEENDQTSRMVGSPIVDVPPGLSDYELLRLRNIARNNARLEALGLATPGLASTKDRLTHPKKQKRPGKRPAKMDATTALPKRRSTRLSQPKAPIQSPDEELVGVNPQWEQDEAIPDLVVTEQYEVSPLVQYEMESVSHTDSDGNHSRCSEPRADHDNLPTPTLVPCDYRLAPSQGLSAIYSLNFFMDTSWLVGAGKSGIVALWNCNHGDKMDTDDDDTKYIDPVFTWKSHGGRWIAEALFLPSNDGYRAPKRLATAANDGTVCLWDLSQVSTTTGTPRLQQQSNKTWHASGIFAMDVTAKAANKIVTGSKDKTVAIAPIDGTSFTPIWRSYCHQSKVGAVQFRDDHVLATASDDGCVGILDDRMEDKDASPVAMLQNLHQGRPHSVVWDSHSPSSHGLLTAGLDAVIQQWDIRQLQKPVREFFGHVPISTRRCKRIHHPVFYNHSFGADHGAERGRLILTGGEGSHALSIFRYKEHCATLADECAKDCSIDRSSVCSRGNLPKDCSHTDVGSIAVRQDLVAATVEGQVMLLKPKTGCPGRGP